MSQQIQRSAQIGQNATKATDSVTERLREIMRQIGERCVKCKHLIVLEHDEGRCLKCDCVRVRQFKKHRFALSELFNMESMQ